MPVKKRMNNIDSVCYENKSTQDGGCFMTKRLIDLLGIRYPLLQGGMAWISDAVLAAAVSNAGGAGIISTGGRTTEYTQAEIRRCRQLGNYGVGHDRWHGTTYCHFPFHAALQEEIYAERTAVYDYQLYHGPVFYYRRGYSLCRIGPASHHSTLRYRGGCGRCPFHALRVCCAGTARWHLRFRGRHQLAHVFRISGSRCCHCRSHHGGYPQEAASVITVALPMYIE